MPLAFRVTKKSIPWGSYKNFDARGRWRDQIEETIVDATCELPNDVRCDRIKWFNEHLVRDQQEQFVCATVRKWRHFNGTTVDFSDRMTVKDTTRRVREPSLGVKTILMCVATNDLFQAKK